jgi:hypothetical protein
VHIPENLDKVFRIIPNESGRSRNSGIGVLNHDERKLGVPENLDKFISGYSEILWRSRNFGPVFSILPKCCARSRNSEIGVLIMTKEKRECTFQKIWTIYF